MTYLRLLWIHLRLGVMHELQYRTNLIIQVVQSTVGLATALLGSALSSPRLTRLLGGVPPSC